jgi:neutral ceramidase
MRSTFAGIVISVGCLTGADFKAGVATVKITPTEPIYLSGYAARTHASDGVAVDIHAKALAIEDQRGGRVVIVTTDIIGLPRSISDPVAAEVLKQYGLDRSRLMMNSSHTHTGPLIRKNLEILFDLPPADQAVVDRYAAKLTKDLVDVVGASLRDMKPANLEFGNGAAHFGINRRTPSSTGFKIAVNPDGPTDPDVPVLKVTTTDGKELAILFGYACHNTTLTAEFYKVSGDYAGYAQLEIEKAHPGATALFLELCGADQNPNPRSSLELAKQHGAALGAEVNRVVGGKMQPVKGRLRTAFQTVDLPFAHHTREQFQALVNDKNVFKARRAKAMVATYDQGHPIRTYPYPVQAIAFGNDVTLVALGGEVVIDYDLRVKKEFGAKGMVVAGYSNDVMAYIPSKRVLKEGGYEADDSMTYYGQPGPWADDVEERIAGTIHKVMGRVGRKAAR